MSKAARLRRKRAKARKARIKSQKRPRRSTTKRILAGLRVVWGGVSWAWKVVAFVLVLLSGVTTVYFFTWRLSVTPGVVRANTAFFILQNDGQFPIYNVKFLCGIAHVIDANKTTLPLPRSSMLTETAGFDIPKLDTNSKTTAPCFLALGSAAPILRADISLIVTYTPSLFPFGRTKTFRYILVQGNDGSYDWIPIAN